jgi:arylsulfatase
LGFEHFYGFMAAETNQFTPALYRDNTPAPTLRDGVLDKALVDDAIDWIHNQKGVDPDKPFFAYLATGTAHAPVQAPKDWIARFRGKFDAGWDKTRAETVARQIRMGLLPKGTEVSPRPEGIAAWDALSPAQKQISARMMEVYAGMLAYQDNQFGRLLDELDRMGVADNTLILFLEGDNGAAAEGGPIGTTNAFGRATNGAAETEESLVARLDTFGGPDTSGNYAFGWAWATNAPFPFVKQYASHLGGTRDGLVISWPNRIKARGLRTQFTHVTDIFPTILAAVGLEAPSSVNGVAQQPVDGVDLSFTFDDAKAPARHTTQYFEMMGKRAIYHDGWWANTTPVRVPWKGDPMQMQSGVDPLDYKWELYDLNRHPAQARNLAAANPEKLAEMQRLFDAEAQRNQVYPLDDRLNIARFQAAMRPPRERYTYWGAGVSIPSVRAAPIVGRSFAVTADVVTPSEGAANGTLLALGGKLAGWSFHLKDGRPVAYVAASQLPGDQFSFAADAPLGPGRHQLAFDFEKERGLNAGGVLIIRVDDKEVARGRIGRTFTKLVELTDTMDIGFDADTPVLEGIAAQPFNGKIERVDVVLPPAAPPQR